MNFESMHQLLTLLEKRCINPTYSIAEVIYSDSPPSWFENPQFSCVLTLYNGIVRYWNTLTFVVQRILQYIKGSPHLSRAWGYYLAYAYQKDNQSYQDLSHQINHAKLFPDQNQWCFKFLNALTSFSWEKALSKATPFQRLSLQYGIPSFFLTRLQSVWSEDRIVKELVAINLPFFVTNKEDPSLDSPILEQCTIRVNTLPLRDLQAKKHLDDVSDDQILDKIKRNFIYHVIPCQSDAEYNLLLHSPVSYKTEIKKLGWYQKKYLWFQEKGSVAVVYALDPRPGELILDLCASPGMKSGLIAQLTQQRARIIACELNPKRVDKLRTVLHQQHAMVHIHILCADGTHPPFRLKSNTDNQETQSIPTQRNWGAFDKILIDAPCSGSGTFQTDPDAKWIQGPSLLMRYHDLQQRLLLNASEFLQCGGIMVYSTCSLYPEEGEDHITQIFSQPDWKSSFRPCELPQWWASPYSLKDPYSGLDLLDNSQSSEKWNGPHGMGRLFPSIHKTQGFFIAKFQRC